MGRTFGQNGKKYRSAFKILTGKTMENTPLGRLRRRWENIKIYLKEITVNTRN